MTHSLIKTVNKTYNPGTAGVPAVAPKPATPAYSYVKKTTKYQCSYVMPGALNPQGPTTFGNQITSYNGPENTSVSGKYTCGNVTVTEIITVPGTLGTAGSPGVPGTPGGWASDYNLGWNGGARSVASFFGNGYVEFKVRAGSIAAAGGLSSENLVPTLNDIQFAFIVTKDEVKISESGIIKATGIVPGTLYRIEKIGTTILYKIDGVTVRTTGAAGGPTYYLDTSLYFGGDEIYDPAIGALGTTSGAATAALSLLPGRVFAYGNVVGEASPRTHLAQASLSFKPMTLSAGETRGARLSMLPGQIFAGDLYLGQGEGEAHLNPSAFRVAAYGGNPTLAIDFSAATLTMVGFSLAAAGKTGSVGTCDLAFQSPYVVASNYKQAVGKLRSAPFSSYGDAYEALDEVYMFSLETVSAPITAPTEIYALISSDAVATTTFTASTVHDVTIVSSANGTFAFTVSSVLPAEMVSYLVPTVMLDGPRRADSVAWVVNQDLQASSRFIGYDFNSFAKIGKKYYGAASDGLYNLGGSTDNGLPIEAAINLGKLDFGTQQLKRVQYAYVGVSSERKMYLKVVVEGNEYVYKARDFDTKVQTQRIDIGRGLRGTYFEFELMNSDGADFELSTVDFSELVLTRRI